MGITVTATPNGSPVITSSTQPVHVTVPTGKQGPKGDPGPPGQDAQWQKMTQAEFDALPVKDPLTLYVIIG